MSHSAILEQRRGINRAFRLMLLVILSVVLMVIDQRQGHTQHFRRYLTVATVPIQYVVTWPIDLVDLVSSTLTSHDTLLRQNTHLRGQLLLLQGQLQTVIALQKENRQLRALLQSQPRVAGKSVIAQLLAVDVDPFVHRLILSRGKNKGVEVGQAVLDADGVMGQVIEVGPVTSQVLLITDSRSAVPVLNARTGERAVATGTGSYDHLELIHVPNTTHMKPGDVVVTSGLGQRFPAGYPIGIIERVDINPGAHFAHIWLTPAARLNRSRLVLLVSQPKPKAEETKAKTEPKKKKRKRKRRRSRRRV